MFSSTNGFDFSEVYGDGELRFDLLQEFVLSIPDAPPSWDERNELLLEDGKFSEDPSFAFRRFPLFEDLPPSEELPELGLILRKLDVVLPLDSSSLLEFNRKDEPSKFIPDLLKEPDLPGLHDISTFCSQTIVFTWSRLPLINSGRGRSAVGYS